MVQLLEMLSYWSFSHSRKICIMKVSLFQVYSSVAFTNLYYCAAVAQISPELYVSFVLMKLFVVVNFFASLHFGNNLGLRFFVRVLNHYTAADSHIADQFCRGEDSPSFLVSSS